MHSVLMIALGWLGMDALIVGVLVIRGRLRERAQRRQAALRVLEQPVMPLSQQVRGRLP